MIRYERIKEDKINITVIKTDKEFSYLTGGECASCDLMIDVDGTLAPEIQENLVIHAVVENYNRGMPHDKVDELTDFIQEALNQLRREE